MDTVVSIITTWKDLVVKVFGEYPLAGALMTLLAIGAFFVLERQFRRGQTATNVFLVLLGWAVAVPIIGIALSILAKVWGALETFLPLVGKLTESLHGIYSKHPILVLSLFVLGFAGYFVWKRWWPKVWPNRGVRFTALVGAVIVAAHIAAPIADLFVPANSPINSQSSGSLLASPNVPAPGAARALPAAASSVSAASAPPAIPSASK